MTKNNHKFTYPLMQITMEMIEETVLHKATFNPKVKIYIFIVVLFYMIITIVGIPLIPFWLLGIGQWLSRKFFHTLSCQLSNKNLRFSKGLIFHIEKTIPLENIQDLSFYGGPLLRSLGLTLIRIETAGGGGHSNINMMTIPGVNGAEEFKKEILLQREKVIRLKNPTVNTANEGKEDAMLNALRGIKNELVEIKETLRNKEK